MYLLTIGKTTTSSDTSLIEPAAEQLNAIQRWWSNLNWEEITGMLIQKMIALVFITLLFIVLSRVVNFLIDRSLRSYKKRPVNEARMRTLRTLVKNIVQYTLGFFYLYAFLSIIGIPVGSLLAGAGIAGLAVGLGAQGFMNDLITGFFIITEQQIDVGDYIKLANLSIEGKVTSVGLRTLQLKSSDGTIHYIPNRNITTISNTSRSDMRVLVDVRIDPIEGIEAIQHVIQKTNQSIAMKYVEWVQTTPTIFGIVDLGNNNFAVRTTFFVTNGKQSLIQEDLLRSSIHSLTDKGFTIPNSSISPK